MSLKHSKKQREITSISRQLMQIGVRHSVDSGFGKFLGSSLQSIDYEGFPHQITYRYHIPPALCHKSHQQQSKPILATSAILAIFDELSTYTILLEDQSARPGVSVDLSVDIIQPIYAHEEVTIITRCDKIGKILAFSSMEMRRGGSGTGQLLARGKHVKYLPMGWIYETLVSSFLVYLGLIIYYWFYGKLQTPVDHLFGLSSSSAREGEGEGERGRRKTISIDPLLEMTEGVFQILQITANQNPIDRKVFLNKGEEEGEGGAAEEAQGGLFDLKVRKEMTNLLGSLHGGALATAIEDASRKFKISQQPDLLPFLRLKSQTIRYISAMKGELIIKVVDDLYSPKVDALIGKNERIETAGQSFGYIYSQQSKQLCAEFICTWAINAPH